MPAHTIPFAKERDSEIFELIPASAGIFLLRGHDPQAEPYVGKTANLRRRVKRLLAPPEGQSKRLNLRTLCAEIEYTPTGSDFENIVLLYRTLKQIFPETYSKRLRLNLPPLIRIHWENAYPRAYVTRKLGALKKSAYYGPFRSRAVAEKYLNDMLDLFKSRRCTFELNPDPSFPGCVYSEMKMCLAPCFKGCTNEEYFEEVRRVQDFLDSVGESLISDLAAQRDRASTELDFENAAALHARVEKVKSVVRGSDEVVRRIDRFEALVIQPSAGPDSVMLFPFRAGEIIGPTEFSVLGMMPSNEGSGDSSLYAQPMMAAPVPDAPVAIEIHAGVEDRLAAALEEMKSARKISSGSFMENLAILKRWYYRSNRTGEIFFPNERGRWPMRKILRGISRVYSGQKQTAAP